MAIMNRRNQASANGPAPNASGSTWSCIEGTAYRDWQYVPLNMVADLMEEITSRLPQPSVDDTEWTQLLSLGPSEFPVEQRLQLRYTASRTELRASASV
jgi:hypothetical protein